MKAVLKTLEGFEKVWEVPEPPPPELRVPKYDPPSYDVGKDPVGSFQEQCFFLEYVQPPDKHNEPVAMYHEWMDVAPSKASIKLYEDAVAKVLTVHPDLAQHQSKIIKLSDSFPMKHEENETPVEYLERLYEIAKTDAIKLGMEEEKLKQKLVEQQKKMNEAETKIKKQQKEMNEKLAASELGKAKFIVPADFTMTSQAVPVGTLIPAGAGTIQPLPQMKILPYEPPEPPKPKEPPEVETPKGRMISLKKKG